MMRDKNKRWTLRLVLEGKDEGVPGGIFTREAQLCHTDDGDEANRAYEKVLSPWLKPGAADLDAQEILNEEQQWGLGWTIAEALQEIKHGRPRDGDERMKAALLSAAKRLHVRIPEL